MRSSAIFLGTLALIASAGSARGQTLPVTLPGTDGEWNHVALSPTGDVVYYAAFLDQVAAVEVASGLVTPFQLMDSDYIGGLAVSPSGRLFVIADAGIYELDAQTGAQLQKIDVPYYSYSAGPMVFTSDESRAYLAATEDIYVLQLDPLAFIDTSAVVEEINGLLEVNPQWGSDWQRAFNIALSPDNDRIYFMGDDVAAGRALQTIDGLSTTSDFGALELNMYENFDSVEDGGDFDILLTQDGQRLYDGYGNVWRTSDMQKVATINWEVWGSYSPSMLTLSPDETRLYFGGFGHAGQGTYEGNSLVVADTLTMELIDLDQDPVNGITGVPLLSEFGYISSEMVITPDGSRLYMAIGDTYGMMLNLDERLVSAGSIVPPKGGNEGDVTLRIGGAFEEGTTIALERSGTSIAGSNYVYPGTGGLMARVDLRGAALGSYDLLISHADGTTERQLMAFTVEQTIENATIGAFGLDAFRAEGEATVKITVQNTGNIDLTNLIAMIEFTEGTQYKFDLPAAIGFPGAAQVDAEFSVAQADDGEPIWLTRLPPQGSYSFYMTVKGPSDRYPSEWDLTFKTTAMYIEGLSRDPGQPIIGEICSIGDAFVQAVTAETTRRGGSSSSASEAAGRVLVDTASNYAASKVKDMARVAVGAAIGGPIGAGAAKVYNDIASCFDFISNTFKLAALFAWDPNDKLSSTGLDGFIMGTETINYMIRFENTADAGADAQTVTIEDWIDDQLDLSTLRVTGSSHPEFFSMQVDEDSRFVSFTFAGIGLPPNVTPPEGQGWIEFSIDPVDGLESGSEIYNAASIVFDINEAIDTPEVIHTVDLEAPRSTVSPLEATQQTRDFQVSWAGSDNGAGVQSYTVFSAVGEGAYAVWIDQTSEEQATFTGAPGKSYRFYTVARDRLGNTELDDPSQAASTQVSSDATGDGSEDDGCGCRTRAGSPSGADAALLGVLLLALRRRTPS